MRFRRVLLAVATCALTSVALVPTAAQAGALPKEKLYEACFPEEGGCQPEAEFVLFPKTKTWLARGHVSPGIYGKYDKTAKYWFFYYEGSYAPGCYLKEQKTKTGYSGRFHCEGGSNALDLRRL